MEARFRKLPQGSDSGFGSEAGSGHPIKLPCNVDFHSIYNFLLFWKWWSGRKWLWSWACCVWVFHPSVHTIWGRDRGNLFSFLCELYKLKISSWTLFSFTVMCVLYRYCRTPRHKSLQFIWLLEPCKGSMSLVLKTETPWHIKQPGYSFFANAFSFKKKKVSSQFLSKHLIFFPWDQYSARLLKKPDQCRAVYACSHLFWVDDIDGIKDGERQLLYHYSHTSLSCLH